MRVKKEILVSQVDNPKFDKSRKEHESANPKHLFEVTKATNTLVVSISEMLTPANVQHFINGEYKVTITGKK